MELKGFAKPVRGICAADGVPLHVGVIGIPKPLPNSKNRKKHEIQTLVCRCVSAFESGV